MAIRRKKPTPTYLKLIKGNPGKRPLVAADIPSAKLGPVNKPKGMRGRASQLWDDRIERAFWLTWAGCGTRLRRGV